MIGFTYVRKFVIIQSMKNLSLIKKKIIKVQDKLNKEFDVAEIGVFGSYIRGEARNDSDLDILISLKPEHTVGLIKFNSLKDFLSDLLKIKVDLVLKDGIKPALKKYILSEVEYL